MEKVELPEQKIDQQSQAESLGVSDQHKKPAQQPVGAKHSVADGPVSEIAAMLNPLAKDNALLSAELEENRQKERKKAPQKKKIIISSIKTGDYQQVLFNVIVGPLQEGLQLDLIPDTPWITETQTHMDCHNGAVEFEYEGDMVCWETASAKKEFILIDLSTCSVEESAARISRGSASQKECWLKKRESEEKVDQSLYIDVIFLGSETTHSSRNN